MEEDFLDRFREFYVAATAPAVLELERRVLGSDYGANGYTTMEQADRLGELLSLGPGSRLLDVGSGAGWPALHLTRTTGCRAVLSDVPVDGLGFAARRARRDGSDVTVVVAPGDRLPFRDAAFDGVTHADVLC